MLRALACFSVFTLASLVGCAAQPDGASDTDTALGSDGPPPACEGRACPTRVREDRAMACLRGVVETIVVDGVAHNGSLYEQLRAASGVDSTHFAPDGTNVCSSPAYDCFNHWDRFGHQTHPPLPVIRNDEDARRYDASVAIYLRSVFLDAGLTRKLDEGQADVCKTEIELTHQWNAPPSILAAYQTIPQMGGKAIVKADVKWLTEVMNRAAHRCPSDPLPALNVEKSIGIPTQHAADFLAAFRPCNLPDDSHVGGCPHSFDKPRGPGNFVNAHALVNACSFFWFDIDPTGGCGMSCYVRPTIHFVP